MVTDRTKGQGSTLLQDDGADGQGNMDNRLSPGEDHSNSIASSTFADSLREKISVVRKESAGDVMKLLASSGQAHVRSGQVEVVLSDSSVSDALPFGDGSNGGVEPTHDDATTGGGGQEAAAAAAAAVDGLGTGGASSVARMDEEEQEDEDGGRGEAGQALQSCIECEDQHAELVCLSCEEPFCRPCWGSLHRQGKRAEHRTQAILGEVMPAPTAATANTSPEPPAARQPETAAKPPISDLSDSEESVGALHGDEADDAGHEGAAPDGTCKATNSSGKRRVKRKPSRGLAVGLNGSSMLEECRFIPLRLDARERDLLAMLKGALNVSEYTDRVDVYSGRWGSKTKKINAEVRYALAALAGMMAAGTPSWGQKNAALLDKLEENQEAFAEIFEVGRRYKITNPEKFRSFYGKMMYMLQDVQAQGRAGLNLVKNIKMVYDFVDDRVGLEMVQDKRVLAATADIAGVSMSKAEVNQQVVTKREARAGLLRDYVSPSFSREDVELVLDSIADANNYIAFNVGPVERVLTLLRNNFHPDKPDGEWSLKLRGGGGGRRRSSSSSIYSGGYGSFGSGYGGSSYGMSSMFGSSTAQLSHDHSTQYTFVTQSLRLWSEAMRNMYRLWYFADSDLLSGKASYRLCNTGQGLNRVQSCPSVSVEMRRILRIVQSDCGPWVGLSVVHLGDRDVPNALVFIDKYTQIPRILNPIADAVQSLEDLALDPILGQYVDVGWGGVHNAKMAILSDFFKGGFDGSGDDGGSCIDGRLTSAWNWCSRLPKKAFAPLFYLAGQYGFDGGWSSGLGD